MINKNLSKTYSNIFLTSALALTSVFAQPSFAGAKGEWVVDNEKSNISFISIKNNAIGEAHHFEKIEGNLNKSDQLSVSIDLTSVNTGIEIRDTRMQEHLFETSKFSTATITADVSKIDYRALKKGQSLQTSAPFTLNLHGAELALIADVIITKQADKTLNVVTTKPILLNATSFGLTQGIDKLMALAGLNAIASSIPVTVTLNLHSAK